MRSSHTHLPPCTPPRPPPCSLLAAAGGTPLPPEAADSLEQRPGGLYFQLVKASLLAGVACQYGKAPRCGDAAGCHGLVEGLEWGGMGAYSLHCKG